jgi:hypothetical protein
MKGWKACERRIAELLGGTRIPVSGRTRGDTSDIEHPTLAIEVKGRRRLPTWIEDAVQQPEACAEVGQLPIAVLHQDRRPYLESLIVTRLGDFSSYLGKEGDAK